MSSQVEIIPILENNYVFCIRTVSDVCLVDPGESEVGLRFLAKNKLKLTSILITHHHADHIDGILGLKNTFPEAVVYAPLKNKNQISLVDQFVSQGARIRVSQDTYEVIELPGHTMGILGYHDAAQKRLFAGDVIFGLGCGRLFEGTPAMMFGSLRKIAELPRETLLYCTHEYTQMNLKFVEEMNSEARMPKSFNFEQFLKYKQQLAERRSAGQPSIPLSLAVELEVNPFLLSVRENNLELFRNLRAARNDFRPR